MFKFLKKALLVLLALAICIMLFYRIGYYALDNTHAPASYTKKEVTVKEGSVGVYLLNLDRSPERLQEMSEILADFPWPFQRIQGIDGRALPEETYQSLIDEKAYETANGRVFDRGTVGCTMSHLKALQEFLSSNNEYAVIFEDDARFDPVLLGKIVVDLMKMPKKWDLVTFSRAAPRATLNIAPLPENHHLVMYLEHVINAAGYLVNRDTAHKMLEKSLPIKLAYDWFFARNWELDIKFRAVEPLIIKQADNGSIIEETRNDNKIKGGLMVRIPVILKREIFRIQSDIMRYSSNLWQYLKEKLG